jgi:hypothetical protein
MSDQNKEGDKPLEVNLIANLGHVISTKTITIEELSKGNFVIIGTPKLTRNEIFEVMGVLQHEIRWRDQKLNESARRREA